MPAGSTSGLLYTLFIPLLLCHQLHPLSAYNELSMVKLYFFLILVKLMLYYSILQRQAILINLLHAH